MGEVIWQVDFRKRRDEELKKSFDSVMRALVLAIDESDTAPSEYCAPDRDPA